MTGLKTLVTGVSGYVGAALVPRLARDGHAVRGFARSRERVLAAGVVLDDLVLGDATTGRGLDEALDGIDVAYYLIHSMEGPAGAFVDIERRQAEAFAAAAAAAGVAADRLPRRPAAQRRRAVAPSWLAARRRAHAAGCGAGIGRLAGLDRDRGAFALVPLPGAADRAPAGAGAAGLARQPHQARRRSRRARVPRRRGDPAGAPRRARLGHRRAGRDELRADAASASAR